MSEYCIADGYKSRESVPHFSDVKNTDNWQDEVYSTAKEIADEKGFTRILDIGTGSAFKLMKYFKDVDTLGLDLEPALSFIKNKYPNRKWQESDLEHPEKYGSFDMVICSDVVEHIMNPDDLMVFINALEWKVLVMSTPARDILHKIHSFPIGGPPNNKWHVREWTVAEFNEYASQFFVIEKSFVGKKRTERNHIVVARKKS